MAAMVAVVNAEDEGQGRSVLLAPGNGVYIKNDVEAAFGGKPDVGSSEEEGVMTTQMATEEADNTINALNDEMDGEHRLLSALGNHPSKHKSREKKASAGSAAEHDQKMQAQIDTTNKKVADPKGPLAHDASMKGFSKQLEKATKIKPHDEVEDSDLKMKGSSPVDAQAKTIWSKAKALMKSVPKSSLQWNDAEQLYTAIRKHLVRAIKKDTKKNAKKQTKKVASKTGQSPPPSPPAAPKQSKAEMERDAAFAGAQKLKDIADGVRKHDPLIDDAQAVLDAIDDHVTAHQKSTTKKSVPKRLPRHFKKSTVKSGGRPGLSDVEKKKHKDALTNAAAELTNPK